MNAISKMALGASLLALLAGCGSESPTANNHAMGNDHSAMGNEMMADPSNPYSQAEMQMHERMMAAVGTDVSDTWVKKMIEHHRGAVEMSNIALAQGVEGPVREMAQMTITKQTREIGELEAMAKQGSPSSEAGAAYNAGDSRMHDAMMAAKGADASETWIRKMIEHHRGAIAMSEVVIAQGQDPRVKEKARKTAADQTKEIAELERLLSGEAAPALAAGAPAATSEPPATKIAPVPPKAPPKAAPKPAPKADTPKAATKAAPKAEPSPPAKAECLPEHRAAGHC